MEKTTAEKIDCRSRHKAQQANNADFPAPLDSGSTCRDAGQAILANDKAVKNWLYHQVAPAYDALKADQSSVVTIDKVRTCLAIEHDKRP